MSSGVLNFLLSDGLEKNNRDSWKHLYLLTEISYGVPKSKQLIANLIGSRYAGKIGELLDLMRDFQQVNILIELLSNCFPRKSTQEVGVINPPTLWGLENARNDQFFNSQLYPFRGKHGDKQVMKFIWEICHGEIDNLIRLHNVTLGSSSNGSGGKRLKVNSHHEANQYCYIQAMYDSIFLWDGEGVFLEMDRRHVDITKNLKGKVKINVIGKPGKCFNSTSKSFLEKFSNVKWLKLDAIDQASCDRFFYESTHIRKISEVQTFLALNHTDEDPMESNEDITARGLQYQSEATAPELNEQHFEPTNLIDKRDQLATPEQSDARICTDEWDFSTSSGEKGTVMSNTQGGKQVTPEQSDELLSKSSLYDEQSPLVLAQKRKKIRETTKTLEMLKKGFALTSNPPSSKGVDSKTVERSPSLMITKFETNVKISEKPTVVEKIKTPKIKAVNSIGAKDISILNTIFGKTDSSTHKRSKRQQRLKNYKPVIEVPSQDVPVTEVRNLGKKVAVIKKNAKGDTKKDTKEDTIEKSKVDLNNEKGKRMRKQEKVEKEMKMKTRKRVADEKADQLTQEKKQKIKENLAAESPQPSEKHSQSKIESIENPTLVNTSLLDSTTMLGNTSVAAPTSLPIPTGNAFTDKLNEQIFNSITHFSNEMISKMAIINKELNHKIMKELSEKYQNLFQELQKSFQHDTEEMLKFMTEIKDLMNLPENELVRVIRNRKFGQQALPSAAQ